MADIHEILAHIDKAGKNIVDALNVQGRLSKLESETKSQEKVLDKQSEYLDKIFTALDGLGQGREKDKKDLQIWMLRLLLAGAAGLIIMETNIIEKLIGLG